MTVQLRLLKEVRVHNHGIGCRVYSPGQHCFRDDDPTPQGPQFQADGFIESKGTPFTEPGTVHYEATPAANNWRCPEAHPGLLT
jgi:hypothetical protein